MNILSIFEKTVNSYPTKDAVADEDQKLCFLDLKKQAQQLAAAINSCTDSKDEAIGIFVNRNTSSIVGILGILYSGNYYVPLDPGMPKEKLRSIIEETEMKAIIDLGKESDLDDEKLHIINTIGNGIFTETDLEDFDEERPLYMVYTSGSTGKPKGVLKSHKSMISFMSAYVKKFGFSADDIIGNQSPFFFDAAAKDLYMMMFTGAKMEIIPNHLFSSPYKLIEYLNQREISFISWVPSMLSIIVKVNTFADIMPTTLKRVFFVGESFPVKYLKKWLEALPDIQYVNLFGSSETAGVFATYEVRELSDDQLFLPMGKALDNCEVLLVDDGKIIEDSGVLGEMYISGDSLATCYYKDEEKTREKFIYTDRFSGENKRYFVTGDIARYDDNHDLVFVTRKDFQIKKMGHRIELGEIESIANRCPLVRQSCCVYLEEKQHLKLYCEVFEKETGSKDIMAYLKEKLSDYMWPNKVVILDQLPLNANGKINRTLLKEMN